jgi:phosphate transport system ATP-binding protein
MNGESVGTPEEGDITGSAISIKDLDLWYGEKQALYGVTMDVPPESITALIGPSGCGKSTLLRCLNRMNDQIQGCRVKGTVLLDEENINDPSTDLIDLRRKVGMVFQRPNPFPFSIYENVAYGCRCAGIRNPLTLDKIVESSLKSAALWGEVEDRLDGPAASLSGGQQQRLCIARALAMRPEVILFDEPCSALDPIATFKIEDLLRQLREEYTIVIVTHNMQQAARVSDRTGYMYLGKLMEYGPTKQVFENPQNESTEKYVSGAFG